MRIARNGTPYWRGELENCPAAIVSKPARFLARDWPGAAAAAVATAAAAAAAFGAFARGLRLSFFRDINTRLPFPRYAITKCNPRLLSGLRARRHKSGPNFTGEDLSQRIFSPVR